MTKCVICYHEYGSFRGHCPACGTLQGIPYRNNEGRIVPIAVARNAYRVQPTYQAHGNYKLVDERG